MRLVGLILSLGLIAALAYTLIKGHGGPDARSAPKQTLDQVRTETNQIEQDAQKRVDDLLQKTPASP